MTARRLLVPMLLFGLSALAVLGSAADAQDKKDEKKGDDKTKAQPKQPPKLSAPITEADVKYGPHPRNVLDFWKATSDAPTPLVFCIHGGGWQNGDKNSFYGQAKAFLDKGISVVSINYRLMAQANEQKVTPPVKAPLEDAARALQFVRSKAKEWNIDKARVGATGGSAGGCSSLWLAFHDDLADPKSDDPVKRESTRLLCAAVNGAQVTLDPKVVRDWLPGYTYGSHAFGRKNLDEVEKDREALAAWIKEYSPLTHLSKDDPPVGLFYGTGVTKNPDGKERPDYTHSPVLGQKLAEAMKATGVAVEFHSTAEPNKKYPTAAAYLIEKLKK